MRKSDKATKDSHNIKSGQNQNSVITSNKFQFKSGTNGKTSFFGARRNTLTTSTTSSGYHPHNTGEFNRQNVSSSGVHHQKNWKNKSTDESVISASSCSNTNNTNQTRENKKLQSIDSVNTGSGCGSSQTSGHASHNRSSESFAEMKDIKHEIKAIEIEATKAAEQSVQSLETLQQIQEAKPGNKRALLVDLPPYLYSIPALASFFEPYGEVAMLQILPQKRMWDADLIDLLGASMCNKLANQSLCAVVEFYSARMAKFIIGILRKRLPILKFRCALLKPSAAIELTNQAENLGLAGVVVMKNKPAAKNTISTDSGREASHESDHEDHKSESGCDDVSGNAQRLPSYAEMSESESEHSAPADSASVESVQPDAALKDEGQRFVTSFQINLGR